MKPRYLKTVRDLIVSNYKISHIKEQDYLHTFSTKTTGTTYQFTSGNTPMLEEGERYNIGYYVDKNGNKIVEPKHIAKTTMITPLESYFHSLELSKKKHILNQDKNDTRVKHSAKDGYYWGKKYAWREFGLCIPKSTFFDYLDEIKHPKISCTINKPGYKKESNPSIAYKEDGLAKAIYQLIEKAEKIGEIKFKSLCYSKSFIIYPPNAITDKK